MSGWIAVDWGTTRLRAWKMEGVSPRESAASDEGMGKLDPGEFEGALLRLVEPWLSEGSMDVISCGMVGSRQGWAEARYLTVPCQPLASPFTSPSVEDQRLKVHLIPGLRQDMPADVMRGEETQIAGLLSLSPDFDGVVCLPGSHTKWAEISAGEVVSFRTFMTGELFAAIRHHTVLRHSLGDGWDDGAFSQALADAISRPEAFAQRLFALRAEGLLHGLDAGAATARLSGLLLGIELAAARAYWLGRQIAIVGDPSLAARYEMALTAQGCPVSIAAAERTTLAGLAAAHAMLEGA